MSEQKAPEFSAAYAADVKARFEKMEAAIKAMQEFLKQLGHDSK